jgi:aryl-alcohol dehydrogenase-like predicted oxidoreductase
MNRRRLGPAGPSVSALGLGCMSMVFPGGSPEHARVVATLERALDVGIDFFDTADAYGDGASERTLGDFIAGRRERVFIATKFGNLRMGGGDRKVDGRPEYVASACDASLRRLRIDVIDLYYQHRVDPFVPIEDTVGAMKRLVEQGKVRYLGLSEASAATVRRAHAVHPLTALQTEYSLWTRDPEDSALPLCRELGIGFVPYSPLGRGMLTGAIQGDSSMLPNDRRRQNPRFQAGNLAHNVAAMRPLVEIAERLSATPAQVALAWVLAKDESIVPIPGTTHSEHLLANAVAADLRLDPADVTALDRAFPPGVAAGPRNTEDAMRYMNG